MATAGRGRIGCRYGLENGGCGIAVFGGKTRLNQRGSCLIWCLISQRPDQILRREKNPAHPGSLLAKYFLKNTIRGVFPYRKNKSVVSFCSRIQWVTPVTEQSSAPFRPRSKLRFENARLHPSNSTALPCAAGFQHNASCQFCASLKLLRFWRGSPHPALIRDHDNCISI